MSIWLLLLPEEMGERPNGPLPLMEALLLGPARPTLPRDRPASALALKYS